jgi:hypothetical protein
MDEFSDAFPQRVRFATVTHRGRINLVVEYLPTSNQCDWVVWKHGSASFVRSKNDLPVPNAIAAAERAAKTMLISDSLVVWCEPQMQEHTGIIQMSDDFKVAANRAAMRFPAGTWERMSTHEQANAIYEELRALDMERASSKANKPNPPVLV